MISEKQVRHERDMLIKELAENSWPVPEDKLIEERIDTLNYVLAEGEWAWVSEDER